MLRFNSVSFILFIERTQKRALSIKKNMRMRTASRQPQESCNAVRYTAFTSTLAVGDGDGTEIMCVGEPWTEYTRAAKSPPTSETTPLHDDVQTCRSTETTPHGSLQHYHDREQEKPNLSHLRASGFSYVGCKMQNEITNSPIVTVV